MEQNIPARSCAPQKWDAVWQYNEGLAMVEKNGRSGFIDKEGRIVIPLEWDFASDFSEGYAMVGRDGNAVTSTAAARLSSLRSGRTRRIFITATQK